MTTTVTQKGQVTIPKEIRDSLGIRVGEKIIFQLKGSQAILKKAGKGSAKLERWIGAGKAKFQGFKSVDDYLATFRNR